MEACIVLDVRPIAHQSMRYTRTGLRYQPRRIVEYRRELARRLSAMWAEMDGATLHCPIEVEAVFKLRMPCNLRKAERIEYELGARKPCTKRVDLDNLWKPLGDSLSMAGIVVDDKQVTRLTLSKVYAQTEGIEVQIKWEE